MFCRGGYRVVEPWRWWKNISLMCDAILTSLQRGTSSQRRNENDNNVANVRRIRLCFLFHSLPLLWASSFPRAKIWKYWRIDTWLRFIEIDTFLHTETLVSIVGGWWAFTVNWMLNTEWLISSGLKITVFHNLAFLKNHVRVLKSYGKTWHSTRNRLIGRVSNWLTVSDTRYLKGRPWK